MRIGIDLGGTKMEAIALGSDGRVALRRRMPSPRGSYRATLEAIAGLVGEVERTVGAPGSVGVGIPGTISQATGRIKNANSTWMNGMPIGDDLPSLLGRPIRFENDANCFALSEAADGAGAGSHAVFGVILGTGVGGGLVVDGAVLRGANAIAGEWGHNPLPAPSDDERPGPPCYCGRRGCIEQFLSGPALSRDHAEHGGGEMSAAEIAKRAAAGEPFALASLARFEDRLARALGAVVNIVDPDVIVLGGGLSNIDRLYQAVTARWTRHIFSDRVVTRLVSPAHGDSSGVRGAARLWPA
ncbi:MAG: ROK family protein [Acidobacteria bacterium]|nr:ROK family protein [Acidobacteriota bacterium]